MVVGVAEKLRHGLVVRKTPVERKDDRRSRECGEAEARKNGAETVCVLVGATEIEQRVDVRFPAGDVVRHV